MLSPPPVMAHSFLKLDWCAYYLLYRRHYSRALWPGLSGFPARLSFLPQVLHHRAGLYQPVVSWLNSGEYPPLQEPPDVAWCETDLPGGLSDSDVLLIGQAHS